MILLKSSLPDEMVKDDYCQIALDPAMASRKEEGCLAFDFVENAHNPLKVFFWNGMLIKRCWIFMQSRLCLRRQSKIIGYTDWKRRDYFTSDRCCQTSNTKIIH